MRERALKKIIAQIVKNRDLGKLLSSINEYPGRWVVNPLIGCLCLTDELAKWHAVTALGQVVAKIADEEMESARVVMRRFMWMLNDESGGIGWGVPETMGEVMANHARLAEEYGHMLVAYMREDASYLELEALQRGLLWGAARLAGVRPEPMLKWKVEEYVGTYLSSSDPGVRGQACHCLGILKRSGGQAKQLEHLCADGSSFLFYKDGMLIETCVADQAKNALATVNR